jgi:hypothetical protein
MEAEVSYYIHKNLPLDPILSQFNFVGFEVLTAVVRKNSISCNIKMCSPLTESLPMFQENMLPLSSSSKNKPIKKPG